MVALLSTKFVAVAIDQAYERRQKDAEGEFYRRIAGQGPRADFAGTTQGFYVATPAGKLLLYNNNRDPAKVLRLTEQAAREFAASEHATATVAAIANGVVDAQFNPKPPEGGLVVRVHARVLGGYEATEDAFRLVMQSALSRDNLWVTKNEHEALLAGQLPTSLLRRIARYHLVDGTRGEPPMWGADEVRAIDVVRDGDRMQGSVSLGTADGKRGFEAQVLGHIHIEKGRVVRFELIADGQFWGEGPYTRSAPKGKFPFAVSLGLADGSDVADAIPPQGSRGWVAGYLR